MTGVIEQALKILFLLLKSPRSLVTFMFLICLSGIGYSVYIIQFLKGDRVNRAVVNIMDSKEYAIFYNSIIDEMDEKQMLAKDLVQLCDNEDIGSCFSSFWYINQKGETIQATNYFVVNCVIKYEDKEIFCGKNLEEKYRKTLKEIEIPKKLFNSIASNYSSCGSTTWSEIKNMKNNDLEYYIDLLDIKVGNISLCTYNDNIILLTQEEGHNSTRVGKNKNIGCIDSTCLYESMEMMSEYKKIKVNLDDTFKK